MESYEHIIRSARPGQILPITREIEMSDPMDFFARISDYGRSPNCCFFESREYLAGSEALSFGTARPSLYLTGTGPDFTIKSLSPTGRRMLRFLGRPERFDFCESVDFSEEAITGRIKQIDRVVDEQTRLKSTNQMDVLRAVAFAFSLASKPFRITCGLLGALSYDFIDQFEKLPQSTADLLENPDYELYFADNIFLMDHEHSKGYVVVNCIVTDEKAEDAITEARECFDFYTNMARFDAPSGRRFEGEIAAASTDTDQEEYERMVRTAKRHIIDGDIFQVVLSRTITEPCPDEPLDVYKRLRLLNPSPYMFYLNTPNTVLMGAEPPRQRDRAACGRDQTYSGNEAARPNCGRNRSGHGFQVRGRA